MCRSAHRKEIHLGPFQGQIIHEESGESFMSFAYSMSCCYTGTSTDVSRYAGEYEHVLETTTAGVTIQAPQVGFFVFFE